MKIVLTGLLAMIVFTIIIRSQQWPYKSFWFDGVAVIGWLLSVAAILVGLLWEIWA